MAGDVEGRKSPIACTPLGTEKVAHREAAARKLFAGCLSVRELEDGYAYEFPGDGDRIQEIVRFAIAERECCPFFVFELTFEREHGPACLRMRGPRGAKEFIRENMDEGFVRKHGLGDPG